MLTAAMPTSSTRLQQLIMSPYLEPSHVYRIVLCDMAATVISTMAGAIQRTRAVDGAVGGRGHRLTSSRCLQRTEPTAIRTTRASKTAYVCVYVLERKMYHVLVHDTQLDPRPLIQEDSAKQVKPLNRLVI